MKTLFRQLISDFQSIDLPEVMPRTIHLPELPSHVNKALAFIGMRRSGKTYLLYQLIHALLDKGVPKSHILYLNFEDDRLADMELSDFQTLLDAYYELFPEQQKGELRYFFFDEIQEVENWEKFIRRLLDTETCRIYLSGSSAKMLSKEIATSLRGRSLTREVFPLSFSEYLTALEHKFSKLPSSKERAHLVALSRQYMQEGGFPETLRANPVTRKELIQSYLESVIYRDIVERHDVRNIALLKRFTAHCLRNGASLLSVSKVYRDFKSSGFSLSRNTLYEYLSYLEDAYCVFSLSHFEVSLKKEGQKPRKIYSADPAMIAAYSLHPDFTQSSLLETTVYLHLRRQTEKIYYLHTKDEKEVDFVVIEENNNPTLIQASLSLTHPATFKREIESLASGMSELSVSEGYIVTVDEEKEVSVNNKTIHIIPLWKFLSSSIENWGSQLGPDIIL